MPRREREGDQESYLAFLLRSGVQSLDITLQCLHWAEPLTLNWLVHMFPRLQLAHLRPWNERKLKQLDRFLAIYWCFVTLHPCAGRCISPLHQHEELEVSPLHHLTCRKGRKVEITHGREVRRRSRMKGK